MDAAAAEHDVTCDVTLSAAAETPGATRPTVCGAPQMCRRVATVLTLTAACDACLTMQATSASSWPLSSEGVRLCWLRALCAVAEGAAVPPAHAVGGGHAPDACVSAVLGDVERRVSVLGGREGMPRSLGSVYAASVTRFLGGGLRGVVCRVIDTPGVLPWSNGVAVSRDGSTLLVTDEVCGSAAIHTFGVADGLQLQVAGRKGADPLQFCGPRQVWSHPTTSCSSRSTATTAYRC